MNTASIEWQFEQNTTLPIIRVRGTTNVLALQPILVSKALDLIELANKHDGVPFRHDIPHVQKKLMVSFTLIFKNHKSAHEYIQELQ